MRVNILIDSTTLVKNPGPCAAGIVIKDEQSNILLCAGRFLGEASNHIGVWNAAIESIRLTKTLPYLEIIEGITIYTNNETVRRQILGEYKVMNPRLQPLYEQWNTECQDLNIPVTVLKTDKEQKKVARGATLLAHTLGDNYIQLH